MERFQEFIESWHTNNGLEPSQLVYGLFLKLREEKYLGQNLLGVASEFIESLRKNLEEEWKKKWWDPFQRACIFYLLREAGIEKEETKEKITNHFEQHCQGVSRNIYLKLAEEASRVKSVASGDELIAFLQLFKEHIEIYNQKLIELKNKYKWSRRVILLYAFQLMGALHGFTITRHLFKLIESQRGSNYLFSPSHSHYLINPKETIFMLVKTSLGSGGASEVKKELEKLRSRTEKAYLFTFDTNLSSNLLSELQKANIEVVTVESIKNKCYSKNEEVITLEELLVLCKSKNVNFWKDYKYLKQEKKQIRSLFQLKVKNYTEFPILRDWYQSQVDEQGEFKPISEILDKKN